jgi:hypothetical protein
MLAPLLALVANISGQPAGTSLWFILEAAGVAVTIWGAFSAWRNRHQLGKWFKGPGTNVPSIAAETIDVLKERISQLESDVSDLKQQLQTKEAQIVVLTDLVTKASTVDQLSSAFAAHTKAVLASHAQLHLEIGRIAEAVHAAPLAATGDSDGWKPPAQ